MSLKPSNQLNSLLSSSAPQFSNRRSYDSTTGFYSQQSLHSSGFYVAAATVIAGTPFAFSSNPKVSHCDTAPPEYYIWSIQRLSKDDALKYTVNECKVELKPPYSAFE
ncbi:hypothetical protein J1N35_042752 [Gossypium stocksii]|uniref:Uncharacterized protein n=1 Tax=Gossypium stocksii TaxID=47602 RepID=A0A9D3ZES3_9ROSI|nr:hypothetical protein J1N35_042752 [Gossypium stocksii]